jgi:hypothetical protein
MSELIEQLAKEHSSSHHIDETRRNDCHDFFEFTPSGLEAFAKAYQAAAPIDNVREALETAVDDLKYAVICFNETLNNVENNNISDVEFWIPNYIEVLNSSIEKIRALIPDTQANRTEAAREQS